VCWRRWLRLWKNRTPSSAYKDSQACRTEAEYAYRLKKKLIFVAAEDSYTAKGWLGALLGNNFYYSPWTNAAGFENGCAGIIKALGKKVTSATSSLPSQALSTSSPTNPATPQVASSPTVIAEIAAAQKEVLQKLEFVLARLSSLEARVQSLEASSAVQLPTPKV